MKHLPLLIESLGNYLNNCTGIVGNLGVIAKRYNTDMGIQFVDPVGNHLLPSNECDLCGFHFIQYTDPTTGDFGCDGLDGWKAKGYAIFYGNNQLNADSIDLLTRSFFKFSYQRETVSGSVKPFRIIEDMPDIINQHFPNIREQSQSAQPCTTILKIEYEVSILE